MYSRWCDGYNKQITRKPNIFFYNVDMHVCVAAVLAISYVSHFISQDTSQYLYNAKKRKN